MFATAMPCAWQQALSTQSVPVAATAMSLSSGSLRQHLAPEAATLLVMAIDAPASRSTTSSGGGLLVLGQRVRERRAAAA